jgi:hypothetical protein
MDAISLIFGLFVCSSVFGLPVFLFMVVYLVYVPHRRKQIESLMNFLEDNEHIALLDVKGMNTRRSLLFSNWIPAE